MFSASSSCRAADRFCAVLRTRLHSRRVVVVNRPVIHHVLDNLLKHGVEEVMVNLHSMPEQVRGYCRDARSQS